MREQASYSQLIRLIFISAPQVEALNKGLSEGWYLAQRCWH